MSFRPEFLVSGEWGSNGERYDAREKAETSARRRFMVWTQPTDWRVTESPDPVTFDITAQGEIVMLTPEQMKVHAAEAAAMRKLFVDPEVEDTEPEIEEVREPSRNFTTGRSIDHMKEADERNKIDPNSPLKEAIDG